MEHTRDYELTIWDAEDRIMREDFNADNAKIEAALQQEATAREAADAALGQRITAVENKSLFTVIKEVIKQLCLFNV